ncbi:MAG: hypothetical protein ACE5IK_10635, partial [Acidobacteriota bacterium]
VVAVVATFRVGLRWTGSTWLSTMVAAVLLSSRGLLLYATQVEVYVPATATAVLLVLFLARRDRPPAGVGALATGIGLLALTIFYHQSNVLLCLPLATFLIWKWGRDGARAAAWLIGGAGALVLGAYVAVYVARLSPAAGGGFITYMTRYAQTGRWGNGGAAAGGGIVRAVLSQIRALVEIPPGWEGPLTVVGGVIFLAVVAAAGWMLTRAERSGAAAAAMMLVWLAANYLFFLWWQPSQEEFFVVTLVPLLLLAALVLPHPGGERRRVPRHRVLPATVAALALGGLLPWTVTATLAGRHATAGDDYAEAAELFEVAPRGCSIVTRRDVLHNLRYHFEVPRERLHNINLAGRMLVTGREGTPAPLAADRCAVVPLPGLIPGPVAAHQPDGWLRFFGWALRLAPGAEDGLLMAPRLHVRRDVAGRVYLLESARRFPRAGLLEFCRDLDEAVRADTSRPFSAFENWATAVSARLAAAGVDPMFRVTDDARR